MNFSFILQLANQGIIVFIITLKVTKQHSQINFNLYFKNSQTSNERIMVSEIVEKADLFYINFLTVFAKLTKILNFLVT